MVSGREYNPLTDARGVDSVAVDAVSELMLVVRNNALRLTEAEKHVLENNQPFIGRAMRGYIVEFLAQTADRTTDFNFDSSVEDPHKVPGSGPGLFHSAALVKGLVERGISLDQATYVMGHYIRHAIDTFTERFNEEPELQTYRDPMASVLLRTEEIKGHVEKIMQANQNSDKKIPSK